MYIGCISSVYIFISIFWLLVSKLYSVLLQYHGIPWFLPYLCYSTTLHNDACSPDLIILCYYTTFFILRFFSYSILSASLFLLYSIIFQLLCHFFVLEVVCPYIDDISLCMIFSIFFIHPRSLYIKLMIMVYYLLVILIMKEGFMFSIPRLDQLGCILLWFCGP